MKKKKIIVVSTVICLLLNSGVENNIFPMSFRIYIFLIYENYNYNLN
jgi:hypothetical protein